MAWVAIVALKERGRLDVDAMLARFARVALGMLVGDGHGQAVEKLCRGRVDWSGMPKFREDHEPHREKGRIAQYGSVDHGNHVVDLAFDLVARTRIGQIGLTCGRIVAEI